MPHFKNVIVRRPAKSMINGLTSSPELGTPDYDLAIEQHNAYINALCSCGCAPTVLPALEEYPDSCFVEDPAIVTEHGVIITNPGAESRQGEGEALAYTLQMFFHDDQLKFITAPGTLEGGDVMRIGNVFYVGLSERTNEEGAQQLADILDRWGFGLEIVPLKEVLHLKTGVNYLEGNNLLVSGEFVDNPLFDEFNKIVIPEDEAYAANCIWVNDKVIVPEGYPNTLAAIQDAGYETITVDTSEYRKLDGGLSCLSLRF